MKKKALAFAAAACAFGMLLSGCGSSNGSDTAAEGANIITAYNSEPQHPLIPGNTNETGGGKPVDLLFSRLISFDAKGNASNEVAESITANDDATQYDIKLKDGWKFTDGTDVTRRVLHQGLELRGQRQERYGRLILLLHHQGL